ncbi:hypothetical protein V6N13_103173 [Hibiscus sabdariffa]
MVAFPNLRKIKVFLLRNVKRICQLREVNLIDLSKLKHVWNERTPKTSWPALKKLSTCGCGKIKLFGHVESQFIEQVIPQLEQVSFGVGDIAMINDHQFEPDFFCHIRHLQINGRFDETNDVPFCFVQRFYNLETLEVRSCHFKELSPSEGDAGEDHISASLESLQVWDCHSLINLGSYFSTLQNLTTLYVWKCKGMTELITSSKAQSLACLVTMSIGYCETMREVVASQGDQTTYEIVFEKLKSLQLYNLPSLKSFCLGNHTFRFPSLEWVTVSQCPRINNFCQGVLSTPKLQKVQFTRTDFKGRWAGDLNATVEQLYIEQVGYRDLGRLEFSVFPELADIWSRNPQEVLDLKSVEYLEVCDSDNLRCIFNLSIALSMGRLHRLEIKRCRNLEQVIKEEDSNTVAEGAIVIIDGNKIISIFPHLRSIKLESCSNMTSFYLGSTTLECSSLKEIVVADCPNMTTFVSTFSKKGNEEAIIDDEADTFFSHKVGFPNLEIMEVSHLRNVKRIWNNQVHAGSFPNLKGLEVACEKIKIFGHVQSQFPKPLFIIEQVIPQLEQVSFDVGDIAMINDHQFESDFFSNIRHVHITCDSDETNVFPFCFLQRFYNLETLEVVGSCNSKELSPYKGDAGEDKDVIATLPKLKKLKLDYVNNTRLLWTQEDHISTSLENLQVWHCHSLINLGSYFSTLQNLTTLDIWDCKEMTEMITSCQAQSLVCLVRMRIRECERMREVIASQGGETTDEIVFEKLKFLELDCLISLESFCSGNHTFRFPSLARVTVSQCPRINNFCQGVLSTPKLQNVWLTKTDFKGRWAGDLNTTVEQLYKEQVGYRGLKHLKFSVFPELVDIWSQNPQEMLDLKSVELLEVCDLDNLRCIFNLSVALSLGRLRQLEIKGCSHLEQVIKEEDSDTVAEEAIITNGNKIIIIFPRLQTIELESCSNMTSFYLGSTALECPSLKEITVAECPNMTTFVSTFSRNGNEGAIIGDEVDTFFSDKVAFPNLEKMKVSHLRNVKRIWLSTYCCGKTEIFGHAVPVEKGKSTLPPVALEKASGIQEEFQVHNYTRRPILPLGPKAVRWRHPSLQLLKLNVHGAFQIEDRCGAVGFIVRDVVGSVLGGGAYFIREAYSADFVEAQAVIHALWFVCSKGFKRVIIECDAPAVTSKLKNKFADFSMLGLILEEAKQLMNLFEDVQVRYINKLGNRVAHALAYFGFDCNGPFTFDSNYPDCISELVREDTT